MTGYSGNKTGANLELDDVVVAYLEARDAGEASDQQEWIERYPQFAAGLAEFFADEHHVFAALHTPALAETEDSLPSTLEHDGAEGRLPVTDPLALRPAESRREPVGPDTVLAGRYRIFDCKAGGMGVVYLAEVLDADRDGVQRHVAIKTVRDFDDSKEQRLRKDATADVDKSTYTILVDRFEREAMSWVRLGWHENIILAFDVINVGGKPYLVMQYANSGHLASWIRDGR